MKLARLAATLGAGVFAIAACAGTSAAMPFPPHAAAINRVVRPFAAASLHGRYLGAVARGTPVSIYVHLPGQHENELDAFIASLTTPGSAGYGRYLTPEEFGSYFGATPQALARALAALRAAGFTTDDVAANRTDIVAHAPVERAEALFQTPLDLRNERGRTFFAARFEPAIPLALQGAAVSGLDDYNQFHSHMVRSARAIQSWTPQDLAAGYDLEPLYSGADVLDGKGVTMANATAYAALPSDLATFQKSFNLPPAKMITKAIGGPLNSSQNGESTLDVQTALSVARGATFEQVVAPNGSNHHFDLVYSYIVNSLGKTVHVVTTSWGLCERDMKGYPSLAIDERLMQQAAAEGQYWFSASGDTGTDDCMDGGKAVSVDFPGSSPYVISVGGTDVRGKVSGSRVTGWLAESTWQYANSDGASGGGRSILYAKPSYQNGVTPNDGTRDVPDISALSDNVNDGLYTCQNGVCEGGEGGTSEAAPQWAALFAIIQQRYGSRHFSDPHVRLYQMASSPRYAEFFHDITTGNNRVPASWDPYGAFPGYNAGKGFDLTTGWGSYIGAALVKAY